jgi:hypothetical protein
MPEHTHESWVEWPPGTLTYQEEQTSSDRHWSEAEAQGVVNRLFSHGFGGDRKIFPIRGWVVPLGPKAPS